MEPKNVILLCTDAEGHVTKQAAVWRSLRKVIHERRMH